MKTNYDVIILGTGIAGLSCGIKLAEAGVKIAIITRQNKPEKSNSTYAQGGIINTNSDDAASFVQDIMVASSNTSSIEAAQMLADRSPDILKEVLLEKANTDFDRNEEGQLKYTREAAHSSSRIIYKGDYTGRAIQVSLLNYISDKDRFPNVDILTSTTAIDLITPKHHGVNITQRYEQNKVIGVYAFDQIQNKVLKFITKKVVMATGGISAIYLNHTNASGTRGDGHAMAVRAGAEVSNMEFIQFHPTTFYDPSTDRRFLISEAVRGEGGILRNAAGEKFMENYHPDGELAPRDVVARAIVEEMLKTKQECVYLDITHKDSEWIRDRFPTIYQYCNERKIDITKDFIPVVPAAHYTCGGVKANLKGETNLINLYAIGEVACNGLHGANRLASTSLLEGLTFGSIAADEILPTLDSEVLYPEEKIKNWIMAEEDCDLALIAQDWLTLKLTMWNYVGLVRSTNRLNRSRAIIDQLYNETSNFYKNTKLHDELIGLRNSIEVAFLVQKASMRNSYSVGCFYLKD
jgi:L-aspartate oxidase